MEREEKSIETATLYSYESVIVIMCYITAIYQFLNSFQITRAESWIAINDWFILSSIVVVTLDDSNWIGGFACVTHCIIMCKYSLPSKVTNY